VAELVADKTVALKLEEFLPYRLAILSSAMSRALIPMYARHDLTMGEWHVLMALGQLGQATAKAVGAMSHMHKTNVSRAAASLLRRNFIVRKPNQTDRREAFLALTPRGRGLYERCLPSAADFIRRLEDAIAPADRAAVDRCLARLAERSRQLISDPYAVEARRRPAT
jgi:DNA-binding MarR family transcriptional regulator